MSINGGWIRMGLTVFGNGNLGVAAVFALA